MNKIISDKYQIHVHFSETFVFATYNVYTYSNQKYKPINSVQIASKVHLIKMKLVGVQYYHLCNK